MCFWLLSGRKSTAQMHTSDVETQPATPPITNSKKIMRTPLAIVAVALAVLVTCSAVTTDARKLSAKHQADLERINATFRVCGVYCGPNWCSDQVISEQDCVADGYWGIPSASGNCADSCCRTHDYCCGSGTDRPACNDAIVACIQSNECYYSICGAAVWAAMKIVDDWCCGSPCPTYFDSAKFSKMSLAGHAFCHKDSGVKIAFGADDKTASIGSVHANEAGDAACAAGIPFSLDQELNTVTLRGVADKAEACEAHPSMQQQQQATAKPVLRRVADTASRMWYFPQSRQIVVSPAQGETATLRFDVCE